MVGPLVGGFLSKPEENFPSIVKAMPWLRKVRYWIPCFFGSILCLFTAIFTWIAAPETVSREMAKKAKEEKKRNQARVAKIKENKEQGKSITTEDEMLLALSQDTYLDLIQNKRVITACSLYGMHFYPISYIVCILIYSCCEFSAICTRFSSSPFLNQSY